MENLGTMDSLFTLVFTIGIAFGVTGGAAMMVVGVMTGRGISRGFGLMSAGIFAFVVSKCVEKLWEKADRLADKGKSLENPAPEPVMPDIDWSQIGWITLGTLGVVATVFTTSYIVHRARYSLRRDAVERERLDRIWAESVQRHDQLRGQWLDYQQDIEKVLSFPLLSDVAEPSTAAFIEALGVAADLASERRPKSLEDVERYARATRAAETRWQAALQHAQRARLARFAPGERDRIKKVQRLLAQAMNGGACPEERRTYYQRARELLGDLIPLPEPARLALEQSVRGELAAPVLGKHRRRAAEARH